MRKKDYAALKTSEKVCSVTEYNSPGKFAPKHVITIALFMALLFLASFAYGEKRINFTIEDHTLVQCVCSGEQDEYFNVTIPDGITTIGAGAFSPAPTGATGNYRIRSISMPDTVTVIENYAFTDLVALETVSYSANIQSIGDGAFWSCHSLKNFPDNCRDLASIGSGAFYNSGIQSASLPAGITRINDETFYGCSNLTSIIIPGNVKSIGEEAFSKSGLVSATLEKGVETIGDKAFYACNKLKTFVMNDGLKTIGELEFILTVVEELVFPDSVTTLPSSAIQRYGGNYDITDSLKHVRWPGGVKKIPEGQFVAFGLEKVEIGEGVTEIGPGAFKQNYNLRTVVLPETLILIDDSAFIDARSLESLTIPEKVAAIGDNAFYGCTALTELTVPGSVKSIGSYAFNGCTGIKEAVLKQGVETLADRVFSNCTSLQSITLPDGLKSIGFGAFAHTLIKELLIPDSVTSLDTYFTHDGNGGWELRDILQKIHWPAGVQTIPKDQFSSFSMLETVEIPEGVQAIEEGAFRNTAVTSISFPKTMETLGRQAFYDCDNLAGQIVIPGNVKSIGELCFSNCDSLNSVDIQAGVQEIGNEAFSYCDSLAAITMGDDLKSIGTYAFIATKIEELIVPDSVVSLGYEFVSRRSYLGPAISDYLKKIHWPAGVTEIPDGMFQSFEVLEAVEIPEGVEVIGSNAFSSTALAALSLPSTLKQIGERAFSNCESLAGSVTIPGSVASIGDYAFAYCSLLESVKLEQGVETIGQYAFFDCDLLSSFTMEDGLKSIGANAFSCTAIKELLIPDSVNSLGAEFVSRRINGGPAISDYLEKVHWPAGVPEIPENLFQRFTQLEEIEIPEGVKAIGRSTFYEAGLKSLHLPDTLQRIDEYAFENCTQLTEVAIPLSVTSIEDGAFRGCTGITLFISTESFVKQYPVEDNVPYELVPFPNVMALPASLEVIEAEAYEKSGVKAVYLPESCGSIESLAFADCADLISIHIPGTTVSIADDAFSGSANVRFFGPSGGAAESFAKENGYPWCEE